MAANITTYSDTNLECGTTFQYRIQVITVAGTKNSNEVSITTAQCTFKLFLPIIFKRATSTGDPGANRDPMFPASVELTTETQFSYDPNGQLISAVTTITISPATDPDGDSLTYSWTASNGTITGAGLTSTWTRVVQSGGVVPGKATVEARDGKGGSDTLTINFN